ncbi:mannose-1-phosphate guanylyltransferase/mannose-6-phosphate isomerase [Paraburkholderia sp. BL18I3N2]|uniref:mannose-1-phosphate guanylyltransferase/mannose-6-phosphate isomerase n=1 Tax=unclassified Paraburkholderia TaxID=2615204 RepID=UPI000D05BA9C|nr:MULTISPECIES: mannose-1-phosphate guanylyltransferase/mannose-6-phosphate isomerase [unclassified Paraburkholderia]PRX26067.1 mannose-1-phosphate guanylyltransferase/mannose-6-phosphate isomerase [Paraburkholderia sp. BL18I3N2]PRX90719.1 mannose-1-phosphate guanylyltransferase/mannose-6-phosphate isomerase [Paraburkholderia sp. BL25I1N1]
MENTSTDETVAYADDRKAVSTEQGFSAAPVRLVPVVLAGGAGSRLWPVSREQYPKQLIDVLGSESLLQATVQRVKGFNVQGRLVATPIVVCGNEHRFVTSEQLREQGLEARIVVEPARRDTAPALTLAATMACTDGDDAIMLVMPADHAIVDVAAFQAAIAVAAQHADRGAIVALGVPPTRADTGFGYIKLGDEISGSAHLIEHFVEKPAAEVAALYAASGQHWWNSGIFVLRASVWLTTLKRLQPAMYDACLQAQVQGHSDSSFFRPGAEAFKSSPTDSIDYAVMEHLGSQQGLAEGVVVQLSAGWSDLGSWDAVWDALEKDNDGNASRGRVVFEGTTSSFAHSEKRLIACVGMTNVVVVETDDAVLVADRSRLQEVKSVVSRMRALQAPEAEVHRKVRRPWGYYDSIDRGERFQVKRIVVNPGGRLSLQLHHHRAEHWTVVSGTALVTRGNEEFVLSENQSTFIPLGVAHRLENPGKLPLELIEVQSGSYLGEDDIIRLDDTYGRA